MAPVARGAVRVCAALHAVAALLWICAFLLLRLSVLLTLGAVALALAIVSVRHCWRAFDGTFGVQTDGTVRRTLLAPRYAMPL